MGHSRGVHNNDVNITTIQIGGDVKVDQKCREYSAETLRAHGVHWKVDAINASVRLCFLCLGRMRKEEREH